MNERLSPAGATAIAALREPSPLTFLHCAIFLAGGRRLGSEHFRLVQFQGQEASSEPFDFALELHGNTSAQHGQALEFEELIGRPVTVGIAYPAPRPGTVEPDDVGYGGEEMAARFEQALRGGAAGDELALFNGIVAAFAMEVPGVYRITMKPALHKLTLTNHYRVHPQCNIRDAIAALLDRHHIAYSMAALDHAENMAVRRVQDWLQAGESDFDFLRRLMGKAHLYFYFVHGGTSHKLVFANHPAYPPVFASARALRYTWTAAEEPGLAQCDVIFQYSYQRALTSSSVHGVFTRQHACWEHNAVTPSDSYAAASQSEAGELPFRQYRIFQYGCTASEVDQYTAKTHAAMAAAAHALSGASYCAHLRSGHQFLMEGSVSCALGSRPVRPALDGQRFVLTQVKHEASADGSYQNQFQAAPAAALIAPYSMQETQQGSVLAEVVERAGSAPVQDWRYYTRSHFDPEQGSSFDLDQVQRESGVYVRFSNAGGQDAPVWVKLAPHMQTVPEPGSTVLVVRAQDESELPEIQSIIHNNGTKVIQPQGWTANSHVGSAYSTHYGDGKSVRFGLASRADLDQAKAKVEAAYGSALYREASYAQGASYSFACSDKLAASAAADEAELHGPYWGADDLLSASESFGSNYSRHHAKVVSSYTNTGTSYNKSVTGQSVTDSHVSGTSSATSVHGGDVSSSTTINANSDNTSIITGLNSSKSLHTASASIALTGVQTGSSNVGINTAVDLTGVSMRTAIGGDVTDISISGEHTSVQVAGTSTSVAISEASHQIQLNGPGLRIDEKAQLLETETRDLNVTAIVALQIFL
ncbi:MAG: phage late control D family protein [Pseudomonadota bacterium]